MNNHRTTRIAALTLVIVAALPTLARAQMSSDEIEYLDSQKDAEGWTFDVGQNPATFRPLESLCELQTPADWQTTGRPSPWLNQPNGQLGLPASYDWRAQGGVTAVRNQGGCGSCWAFATVGVMEAAILIRDGITTDLSEQYLVSCNSNNWSCSGGWYAHDYHWNRAGKDGGVGAVLESTRPYLAKNTACGTNIDHLYTVNNWYYVNPYVSVPDTAAIKQAILSYGPVSVAVYVNNAFQAYTGGVFNGCSNGTVNHAVVLVGWNDADQAWIMRNSWGPYWGEQGYMRIRYGCSQIGYAASYVDYGSPNTGAAAITSPTPSSTLTSETATFTWSADANATEYWLSIGDSTKKGNIYSASAGTSTTATVTTLPVTGKTLYVKLFSKIDGKWYGSTCTYTAANIPAAAATITSPANGSTFNSSTVTFTWSPGARVTDYTLWVGRTAGGYDLFKKSLKLERTVTLSNLPAGGTPIYVRLICKMGATTSYSDYTYTSTTSPPAAAALTAPVNGSTFTGAAASFAWSEGLGIDEYLLEIGSTVGGKNIYRRSQARNRSLVLSGLPTNGSTVYVRLWSRSGTTWMYNDYQYSAANLTGVAAALTSHADGATLTDATATFTWSPGVAIKEYKLSIGTAPGKTDIFNKSAGLGTTITAYGLPTNGSTLYVRLWSMIGSTPQKVDYTLTAANTAKSAAELTSPVPSSTLSSSVATFSWTAGVGATEYSLMIQKTVNNVTTTVYNASQKLSQSVTVPNLPTDGSTLTVKLSSRINNVWQARTYTLRAAAPGSAKPFPAE